MKKHDEGYTLPFVLVILTILYFVVSIVLTSAETTVTAQQQSIAQMKQKYAAQGKIEMLVGQLCDEDTFLEKVLMQSVTQNAIEELCNANGVELTGTPVLEDGVIEFAFKVLSEQGSVMIESQIKLTCKYSEEAITDEITGDITEKITITELYTEYVTYDVGTTGGDAP